MHIPKYPAMLGAAFAVAITVPLVGAEADPLVPSKAATISRPTLLDRAHSLPVDPVHILDVDGSANNAELISPKLCAAACFAATYSFSTVPYFSLDQQRNVTLVYNSDHASPRPFIFADVDGNDGTGVPITRFTMSATVNGSPVTFLDGQTLLTFSGSLTRTRLTGQFDAWGISTGVYPMIITIEAYYDDGTDVRRQIPADLMVLNETESQIARGWTVAGLQRLRPTVSPGYLITEGDGSGVRFTALGVKAADYSVLTYDAVSASYTRTYTNGSRAIFNSSGLQTSFIEPRGRAYTFGYDSQGRIQEIRDPYRKQPGGAATAIGLSYDANGLRMIQEPGADGSLWAGRTTWFVVNGNRCLVTAQDPDGHSTAFACDADGRLMTATDRRGGVTTFWYDPISWKLSRINLPQIPVDAGGGNTTLSNPVIRYGPWQTETMAYVQDPAGRTTSFLVNRYGQAIDITDPVGLRTTISTNGILPALITHPGGATDTLMYDASGRLMWSHPAGGTRTEYHYNASNGLVDVISGPGSRLDSLFYVGNQVSRITYSGNPRQTVDFTYDPGTLRPASATDNSGHTRSYSYDTRFGNLSSTTLPGNRVTNKYFDAYGRDSVVAPPGLAAQTSLYDAVNRITSSSAGGTTITLGYDQLFQTDLYDANNNHYHTDHNALGWPTRQCDALAACSTVRYDVSGEVMSSTNRRGQLISLTRDAAGRITSKSGGGLTPSYFSYSTNGRDMVAWNSVQRDSIFTFPGTDLLPGTDSVVTWIDGKRFRVFHRAPRAVADLHVTTITSNTGVTFNDRMAFYSASGFLDSLKIGGSKYGFVPDADGTGGVGLIPNGGTRTSHALTSHRTADVRFSNDNLAAPFRREYHFNLAGKIDQVMHDDLTSFTYDELGRLTSSSRQTGCFWGGHWPVDTVWGKYTYCTTPVWTHTYTYDAMGNRTNHGGVPTTGNRYIRFSGVDYSYDADGNVTQKYNPGYNRQFYWNAANQLDSVIKDGSYRTAFDYDAFGRPVRIRGGNATGLQVTGYLLWDGDALLAELRPNGEREIDYVYLPGTIDRPFASTLGATTPIDVVFHEIDELGNVVGSHVNGVVSQSNSYDAWGTVTSFSPESRLFWKGLFWNSDSTGVYYMRNRWYDPEGERFLSEDPAGFAGGINLYTFSGNDPVNGRDPFGLCPVGAALEHALQLLANQDEVSWSYKCTDLSPVIVTARWPGPAESDWTAGPTGAPWGEISPDGRRGGGFGGPHHGPQSTSPLNPKTNLLRGCSLSAFGEGFGTGFVFGLGAGGRWGFRQGMAIANHRVVVAPAMILGAVGAISTFEFGGTGGPAAFFLTRAASYVGIVGGTTALSSLGGAVGFGVLGGISQAAQCVENAG